MAGKQAINNKRIAKNTMALYVRMFLVMAITLYTSRIVLKTLGIEDYGIYNVVGGVVVLFSFLNSALANATQRFLNFEMGTGNEDKLRTVFSCSMMAHYSIVLFLFILCETVGLWFVNHKLNIPEGREYAAFWAYQCSVLIFCIKILCVPFRASIIACEKMGFFAVLSIGEVTAKLLVVYMLLWSDYDRLIIYAILSLLVNSLVTLVYIIYCKFHTNFVTFQLLYDKLLLKNIFSFSIWSCWGNLSNIVASQGLNILANMTWGVLVNAAMGVSHQVSNAVYGFTSNFQTAFNPQLVKLYAAKEMSYYRELLYRASRISFYLFFIVNLPLLLNTDTVLDLWLVEVPEYCTPFCRWTLVDQCFFVLSAPLWISAQAIGNIRNYMLWVSVFNILSLPLAYLFSILGAYPYFVIVARLLMNISVYIYRIFYLWKKNALEIDAYYRNVICNIVKVTLLSIIFPILVYYSISAPIPRLIFSTMCSIITTILIIYSIGLTQTEKNFCINLIKQKLNARFK